MDWTKPEAYGDPATLRRNGLAKGDVIDQIGPFVTRNGSTITIVDLTGIFSGKEPKRG